MKTLNHLQRLLFLFIIFAHLFLAHSSGICITRFIFRFVLWMNHLKILLDFHCIQSTNRRKSQVDNKFYPIWIIEYLFFFTSINGHDIYRDDEEETVWVDSCLLDHFLLNFRCHIIIQNFREWFVFEINTLSQTENTHRVRQMTKKWSKQTQTNLLRPIAR